MLTALTAALLMTGAMDVVKPRVVAASLFKNGYAVIVREVPLSGSETFVDAIPQGSLGTLWITGSKGVKFDEIVNTNIDVVVENQASSLDQMLSFNVGRTMTLGINADDQVVGRKVTGKLVSASGQIVIIETEGKTQAFQKSTVTSVTSQDGDLIWVVKTTTNKRGLRIKAQAPADGKAYIVALERGACWAPAYSLDISDPKKMKIVAKATILNDLSDFDDIEVKLVTGFPNLPFAETTDPLAASGRVDEFTSALMRAGTPTQYRMAGAMGGALMTQNAMRADFRGGFDQAFAANPVPGDQLEDLFFYRQPGVKMKTGDRGYYVLFSNECDYDHLYTWDVDSGTVPADNGTAIGQSETPGDVWHCLKFKNETKQPFTTAPATTFKNGEILGQDTMNYTSVGAETLVKITKALDLRADKKSEEIARERGVIKDSNNYPIWDLVTVKETFSISNRKSEKVKVRVNKNIRGDSISADFGPKDQKTAQGLSEMNPIHKLEWNIEIEPGKTQTLTCTYKTYVYTRR